MKIHIGDFTSKAVQTMFQSRDKLDLEGVKDHDQYFLQNLVGGGKLEQ